MTRLVVSPDRATGPGHAVIRVAGAAAAIRDPCFQITRVEGEKPNLGPGGWQAATAQLAPLGAETEGADLVLHVGPTVVDNVLPGTVRFTLDAAEIRAEPLRWPSDIATSADGWDRARETEPPRPPPPPTKPPPLAPPQPSPLPQPSPPLRPPATVARSGSGRALRWALGGALVLALLVGAGFAARHYFPAKAGPNQPPRTVACSGSVAAIIACAKTPEALFASGRHRWAVDPNGAFIILQAAADRGSAEAAYFLARHFDPVGFRPGGPIPKAEPREAARDYRIAAKGKVAGATGHRAALKAWLEDRAKAGDAMAPLTLHDFWSKP